MVVGFRQEFNQNFPNNAYPGFLFIRNGQLIKLLNDLPAQLFKSGKGRMLCRNKILAFLQPFLVQGIGGTFFFFLWAHPVQTTHENIAEYSSVNGTQKHIGI